MTDIRAQVTLRTTDNVPANFITNSFAFDITFSTVNVDFITAAIKDFYDDINSVAFSGDLAQNGHQVKYYALPGVQPNYPQDEALFNLAAAPVGDGLPSEVAIVLSFQGVRTPGVEQARRRGRIYLGPLKGTINTSGRPNSSNITTLATAAATFKDAVETNTGGNWTVWSPTSGSSTPVDNGWIDNAFDTQRRRGIQPTTRTIWS